MTEPSNVTSERITERMKLPQSATHTGINLAGLLAAVITFLVLRQFGGDLSDVVVMLLCVTSLAGTLMVLEMSFLKTFARPSTGLNLARPTGLHYRRVAVRCLGLGLTFGLIALAYWIFPEYHGAFYELFFRSVLVAGPFFLLLGIPYFVLLDRYLVHPEDGYWHLGLLALGCWKRVDTVVLKQHLMGWGVKAFFLPLMVGYMIHDMQYLRHVDIHAVLSGFSPTYDFVYNLLFTFDVMFAVAGYSLSLRFFDSHIRSAEPTLYGWLVALMCYEPFWNRLRPSYFNYNDGYYWGPWLAPHPVLYVIWGCLILACLGLYAWATVSFGIRFSNLTHRGILTNGPYRWTRHPAYVFKNTSYWLVSIPFISSAGPAEAIRHSAMLMGVNLIYFLRARTEERHLAADPVYVQYARYIDNHGWFAWIGRLLPALRLQPLTVKGTTEARK